MENTAETFEQILQNQCAKKTSLIYQKNAINRSNFKPQDVIETVNAQIKAIQLADSAKNCKPNVTRSRFPSVRNVPVYKEVPKQIKFETQCISDTQLINIIENVEAVEAHEGMTQEFDNTFINTDTNNIKTETNIEDKHVSELFTHMDKERNRDTAVIPNKHVSELFTHMGTERDGDTTQSSFINSELDNNKKSDEASISAGKNLNLRNSLDVSDTKSTEETELTNIANNLQENVIIDNKEELNNSIELFTEDQAQFHDLERSPSPVLNPKPRRKRKRSDTPPSFTVPLELFENFEKTYIPLIDLNSDTKVVINSQILDKELCINSDTKLNRSQLSPIFDLSIGELHVDQKDLKLLENDALNENFETTALFQDEETNIDLSTIKTEVKLAKEILQDEILFSSDEEEYVHKELEDLPLTCVLETSFYDDPGILEKTMYVGFHTASNKSILIQTGSFEKAQSILNNSKEFSLTELVDIYGKSLNLSKDINNTPKLNSACGVNEEKHVKCDIENKPDAREGFTPKTLENSQGKELIGFKTANNTKMNISNKAKAKICDVFKDINLNDQFDDPAPTTDDRKSFFYDDIVNEVKLQNENKRKGFIGFRTANNSKINISNEAKAKICDVFKDIDLKNQFDDPAPTTEDRKSFFSEDIVNEVKLHQENKEKEFIGFRTANNTKIKISDKAKAKIRDVFKDINLNEQYEDPTADKNDPKSSKHNDFSNQGNLTPNSKLCYENDPQLDENLNDDLLIQEFENIEMSLEETESKNMDKITFEGFKTASDKKIKISDGALLKMKNIFQDIDLTEIRDELDDKLRPEIEQNETDDLKLTRHIDTNTDKTEDNQEPKNTIDLVIPSTSKAFQGFITASNKIIKISDASMSKTKNIFKDIDSYDFNVNNGSLNTDKLEPNTSSSKFEGFKTARNKIVNVSEESLAESKKIFENIDTENYSTKTESYSMANKNNNPVFKGFLTASNKPGICKVSDQSLAQSKKIFQDMDTETCLNKTDSYNKIIKHDNPVFKGFKTASNKPVKVSEESLAKSKEIFQDMDTGTCINENDSYNNGNKDDNAVFKGFQTASNKPVKVFNESLAQSRKIFQDMDTETCMNKIDSYNKGNKDDDAVFKGFQTASNKPVKVSEESLAKSKIIFQDMDTETCLNKTDSYDKRNKEDNAVFKGFQTASNKPVKISEESLAKSKKIFENIDTETSNNTSNSNRVKDHPTFKDFQTANKKSVDISEKALLESKKIFKEFNEDNILVNIEPTTCFKGFKTANDKEVIISENALAQSKTIFEDFAEPIYTNNKIEGFTGFQTANNKNVKISKEAIEKTKHLFKDFENHETEINQNVTKKPLLKNTDSHTNIQTNKHKTNLNIFATANNKALAITEDSLAKSKEILNEKDKSLNIKKPSVKAVNTSINIDNLINTQVINNFEDNLCTEDFRIPEKRSTSPILSCPRAKKRKFETPYKLIKEKIDTKKEIIQKKNESYFDKNYKKNKILKLKDLKIIKNKTVDPYITEFNINNLLDFEFKKERHDLDGIDDNLNIDKLKSIFIDGVDEKIIPNGWLDIHVKLIIWKLLSYEVKYNFTCTAKTVLDQLKYRYDKELFRVERSALRKILEKDDVPSKTMVLCVADILVNGESVTNVTTTDNIELLLTDGWYFIKATIDKILSKLVYDKNIFIGCKLASSGAELLNCEQGVSPWEDISSIRLKLSYNSTRPAHFDARLGYCQSAILSQLSTVKIDGGKICKLRVFVTRVYPLLYVEKFEDGSTVTRSERLEHLHQIKYESEREAILERIYEEVQKELSDQESQDSESYIESNNKRRILDSGSQIAKMMKKSADPMEFRAQLTTSQIHLLQDHTSKYRDKMLSIIQDKMRAKFSDRNVVPLARAKIADVTVQNGKPVVTTGMLSIWKPNDELMELFKENSWIEVMNVIPTAIRYSEIQVSAGRQSVFRQSKHNAEPTLLPHLEKLKRKIYKIEDLLKKSVIDNEVDTVGLIFLIDPSEKDFDATKQFQNVYLADENKNMICINFWGGIKKFGFHNVIDPGQIISCANLQRRAGNTRKNIPQFRVTEFTSITKTPKNPKSKEIIEELSKKLGKNRERFCEDCVAIQNNYEVLKCFDENSPYRFINKSDYNISKNKQFIETPVRQKDEFNLTGLDFESTFKQTDTQLSPKTLLRKKKVNERIAKLKMYGEPPPLSSINILNKSKNATNSYKSPLLLNNVNIVQKNITRGQKLVEMCDSNAEATSPILNRTYVKRNVNPIKLDFSRNGSESKEIDNFSEDFDASPPLSLD